MPLEPPSEPGLDVSAPPRAESEAPRPRVHTRWGIAASCAALVSWGLFLVGFALLVGLAAVDENALDSGWFDAFGTVWMICIMLTGAVAIVCGASGCLRVERRRVTAGLGLLAGLAMALLITILLFATD